MRKIILIVYVLLIFPVSIAFGESTESATEKFLKDVRQEHAWSGVALSDFSKATSPEKLEVLLDDPDWYISYAAFLALANKNQAKQEYLTKIFERTSFTGEEFYFLDLLEVIGSTEDPVYLPRLRLLLDKPGVLPNTKKGIVEAISEIPGKDSWVLLRELTTNNIPEVRSTAAMKISWRWDTPAFDVLIPLTKDKEGSVRQKAAEALGKLGDSLALKDLIVLCEDENIKVREAAAWALGNIRDKRAIPALQKLIETNKKDTPVSIEAEEALRKISGGPRTLSRKEEEQNKKVEELDHQFVRIFCQLHSNIIASKDDKKQYSAQLNQILSEKADIYTRFPNLFVYRLRRACESTRDYASMPWIVGLLYVAPKEKMPENIIDWSVYANDKTEGDTFRGYVMDFLRGHKGSSLKGAP